MKWLKSGQFLAQHIIGQYNDMIQLHRWHIVFLLDHNILEIAQFYIMPSHCVYCCGICGMAVLLQTQDYRIFTQQEWWLGFSSHRQECGLGHCSSRRDRVLAG